MSDPKNEYIKGVEREVEKAEATITELTRQKIQFVEALKKAQRILENVRRANPDGFNNGVYDDPCDENQEQAEAEVMLPKLKELLIAAGEEA